MSHMMNRDSRTRFHQSRIRIAVGLGLLAATVSLQTATVLLLADGKMQPVTH